VGKQVLIIQRRLPQYRVPLFESLRHRLAEENIHLNVVYSSPSSDDLLKRDEGELEWGLRIPSHSIRFWKLRLIFQKISKDELERQDLIILPHENKFLPNYLLLQKQRKDRMKLAFFGHGTNFQEDRNNGYQNKLRVWTARHVDWWFAYSSISVKKVIDYGFPENRITCLNNTIDINELIRWRESISPDELDALRVALDLKGKKVGVFIGGFYKEKRLDFLFSAADGLHRQLEDFELLIIGGGPWCDRVGDYVSNRPWAKWVGAKHDREKVLHLALGHVMLNPGMVGLGILDSFAMGLPMVTTDCRIHSPEIAYLDPGRNGIITDNTLEAFTEEVGKLFVNPGLRQKIAEEGIKDSSEYLLENMVQRFCEGITQALNTPHFYTR